MKRVHLIYTVAVITILSLVVLGGGVRRGREGGERRGVPRRVDRERLEASLPRTYTNASYYHLYPKDPDAARRLLGRVVGEKNVVNGQLRHPAIYIRPFGRLGNNIIELSNAIYLAEVMNASTVYVPPGFAWVNATVTTSRGIRVVPTATVPSDAVALRRELFRLSDGSHYPESRVCEFAGEVLRHVPPVRTDDAGLYIHVRGGDVFAQNPNIAYGQPPLCFYESIIERWGFRRVYVICEDTRNPVVKPLVAKYGAVLVRAGLPETVGTVLSARNLVMSVGTFLPSLLKLVPEDPSKRIFRYGNGLECNRDVWRRFYFTEVSDFYAENIMGFQWRNTEEQRRIMLNETCGDVWKVSVYTRYPDSPMEGQRPID